MCGIAGILTTNDPLIGKVAIQRMIEASKHRGPDACGFIKIPLQEGNLFLGHTRLSIIDLTESRQSTDERPSYKFVAYL